MLQIFLKKFLIFSLILSSSFFVASEESWIVEDIRISGLQRISAGSIFSNIPVTIGDKIATEDIQNISKSIFATGNFDDIQIGRDGPQAKMLTWGSKIRPRPPKSVPRA